MAIRKIKGAVVCNIHAHHFVLGHATQELIHPKRLMKTVNGLTSPNHSFENLHSRRGVNYGLSSQKTLFWIFQTHNLQLLHGVIFQVDCQDAMVICVSDIQGIVSDREASWFGELWSFTEGISCSARAE